MESSHLSLNLVMCEHVGWERGVRTFTGDYGAIWMRRERELFVDCRLTTGKYLVSDIAL